MFAVFEKFYSLSRTWLTGNSGFFLIVVFFRSRWSPGSQYRREDGADLLGRGVKQRHDAHIPIGLLKNGLGGRCAGRSSGVLRIATGVRKGQRVSPRPWRALLR